jgi:hypothetical protein
LKWQAPSTTFVGCVLTKSVSQSLTNGTQTAITWNTETEDTNGFHDNSTNTSRVTIPSGYAGRYLLSTTLNYDQSNGTGQRQAGFAKNGSVQQSTIIGAGSGGVPSATLTVDYTLILNLTVGDYVEVYGYQTSGGALSVSGNANGQGWSIFNVTYLGA